MTKRKTRSDTVAGGKLANRNDIPEIPEGVLFETEEEIILWRQFSQSRSCDSWREFDLLILSKMVKAEVQIRKHSEALERSGPVIENAKGTMVENPLMRVVDTLQRQQLALIRSLSLGVASGTAQDQNRSGAKQSETSNRKKLKGNNVTNLLAI